MFAVFSIMNETTLKICQVLLHSQVSISLVQINAQEYG